MNYKRLQIYFFLAIFAFALILSFFVLRPYLSLMVFSGILALLAWPAYRRLLKFFRGQRGLASFSTVVLTLILVLLPLAFFVASLAVEAVDIFNRVRQRVQFDDVEGALSRIMDPMLAHRIAEASGSAVSNLANYAQPIVSNLTADVYAIFSNAVAVVLGIFIVLIGLYYLLKDGPALKRELLDLSPLPDSDDAAIFERIRDAIVGVAYGSFLTALAKGLLAGLLFFFLKLPTPVFWGAVTALASFVPVIGSALVLAPFAAYLFFTGQFAAGLTLAAVSLLVIAFIDNVVGPNLIRRRVNVHPLLILLSILGGLSVFGALGVFFGPIVVSVTLALLDIYKKEFRQYLEKLK